MTLLMTVLGVVVFAVGLLVSIAWHELGHLSTAKIFGIRVPQYMVGFGPTIWSRRKGETEYGIKAIPMGGYIRMIGMFPPGEDGKVTARSTSPFRSMIEDARSAAYEELQPGDDTRLFYTRKPWKRVIVMFAGPFMNLVLAVAIFLTTLMTFGLNTQTTSVATVSDCVIQQSEKRDKCVPGDPAAPAKAAGLKAGDKIVAFDGRPVGDWSALQKDIRATVGPATITVERAGQRVDLKANLIENKVAKTDGSGRYVKDEYVTAGFLGFAPASGYVPQSFGQSVDRMGEMMQAGVESLVALPSRSRTCGTRPSTGPSASRTAPWASSVPRGSAVRSSPSTSPPSTSWSSSSTCWPASTSRCSCSTCCPCSRSTAGTSPAPCGNRSGAPSPGSSDAPTRARSTWRS